MILSFMIEFFIRPSKDMQPQKIENLTKKTNLNLNKLLVIKSLYIVSGKFSNFVSFS